MQARFTLLSVCSDASVRYFEGLQEDKPSCRAVAEQLCEKMGVKMPGQRHDVSRQVMGAGQTGKPNIFLKFPNFLPSTCFSFPQGFLRFS